MPENLGDAVLDLRTNDGEFKSGLQSAERSAISFGGVMQTALGFAAGQMLIDGLRSLSATVLGVVGDTQEFASEITMLRRQLGLTPEVASELAFALHRVGLSADNAAGPLGIFQRNLVHAGDALEEGDPLAKNFGNALDALGLSQLAATGASANMMDILPQVADAFAAMDAGTLETTLAMDLFGRSGRDLLPLLNLGSAGLAEMAQKAHELGVVLTSENLDQIRGLTIAQREMGEAVSGVKLEIASGFIPALTGFNLALIAAQPQIRSLIHDGIETLSSALRSFAHTVLPVVMPLITGLIDRFAFLRPVLAATATVIVAVVGGIAMIAPVLVPLLPLLVAIPVVLGLIISPVGLVIAGLAALAFLFRHELADVLTLIVDVFRDDLIPTMQDIARNVGPALRDILQRVGGELREWGATLQALAGNLHDISGRFAEWLESSGNLNRGLLTLQLSVAGIGGALLGASAAARWTIDHFEAMAPVLAGIAAIIVTTLIPSLIAWTAAEYAKATAMYVAATAFIAANAPLIAIAIGIGLVVAAIVLLIQHWDQVSAKTVEVWDFIHGFLTSKIGLIVVGLTTGGIGLIALYIIDHWEQIRDVTMSVWEAIVAFMADHWQQIYNIIHDQLELIRIVIMGYFNIFRAIFLFAWAVIRGDWGEAWQQLKNLVTSVFGLIHDVIVNRLNLIRDLFVLGWAAIKAVVQGALTGIYAAVVYILSATVNYFAGFPQRILDAVGDLGRLLYNAGRQIVQGLIDGINSLIGRIPDLTPGFNIPGIPFFAQGGMVPGPIGQPMLAVVHGGEEVISATGGRRGSGGGSQQTINVYVEERSPAAIAHAVEMAGLRLGRRLALEGV